ncbi:diacylglycerol kinase family lipid kinase [Bacillus sp. DTU_2020_1000418_1_SI_GHA_SEK_038]|uniref:diacylglycerol/lipid kinase family protein n=1 Tax=Bacillus sp. DTU_2020_1000418_1_SI_GHA_SEK_038 TaxID=3077585 RepID=UPI0028E6765D|nr:diacylglycerol kinase family lipid kinase [Bacillus sp. DTU_2020_1000418_1_SI_GHA_SEK_038]WNS74648.1 diacylglycerol kinase family lipid kinase [Bacillus sp. DTU_2020_1000418_1_SI_GHA_SEK_038]
MKNIYFIINPQAKNGDCQKVWRKLELILLEQKTPYMAFFTEYRGHAKDIVRSIAVKSERSQVMIIAVGGDGTMHEVINGAAPFHHVHVSFIPGGSGNDFSRGFNISKNPSKALITLLQQLEQESTDFVDIGKITIEDKKELFFINNMGAGFDALISKEVNHSRIKGILNRLSLGKFVYVYFLFKNLFTYKRTQIDINIDGNDYSFPSAWFVTVSNQPYYGGGMKISPDASPYDGTFNITVVNNLSRIKLLLIFITVFWGGHTGFKEVSLLTGKNIKINSDTPLHVHADGEDIGSTPVITTACQKKLPVVLNSRMSEKEVSTIDY